MATRTRTAHDPGPLDTVITVTAEDIMADCPFPRSINCPVARAVNRELLPGMYARVDSSLIRVYTENGEELWGTPTPAPVADFITKFDDAHDPFNSVSVLQVLDLAPISFVI